MAKKKLTYRMYGLVPYNISPIQQGIQFGHAVVEYANKWSKNDDYKQWSKFDKTFIILNGGTTNTRSSIETGLPFGSLNRHALTLKELGVKVATFNEPDLGDQLTAVVFLVDERVFDRSTYPDDPDFELGLDWTDGISQREINKIFALREFLRNFKLA